MCDHEHNRLSTNTLHRKKRARDEPAPDQIRSGDRNRKEEPLILHALGVSDTRQRSYTRPVDDRLIHQIEVSRPTILHPDPHRLSFIAESRQRAIVSQGAIL